MSDFVVLLVCKEKRVKGTIDHQCTIGHLRLFLFHVFLSSEGYEIGIRGRS